MTRRRDYDGAKAIYRELNESGMYKNWLYNKGILYLLPQELDRALECFSEARRTTIMPVLVHEFIGTTLWLKGQYLEAAEDWANGTNRLLRGEITHSTETGDVPPLLYWASLHPDLGQWK